MLPVPSNNDGLTFRPVAERFQPAKVWLLHMSHHRSKKVSCKKLSMWHSKTLLPLRPSLPLVRDKRKIRPWSARLKKTMPLQAPKAMDPLQLLQRMLFIY